MATVVAWCDCDHQLCAIVCIAVDGPLSQEVELFLRRLASKCSTL